MATYTAASASASDVQHEITTHATTGDTVIIPSGTATWNALSCDKAITIQGAGQTAGNNITLGSDALSLTKSAAGVMRWNDLRLTLPNVGFHGSISGSWLSADPIVFNNCTILGKADGANFVHIYLPGGVIFSGVTATWDYGSEGYEGVVFTTKDSNDVYGSWSSADTMGANDTTGKRNIYFEAGTYTGLNLCDNDDCGRVVIRNTICNQGCFNSHGCDTSAFGLRHFEIYDCQFRNPVTGWNQSSGYIWVRGGSGVVYNNSFEDLWGWGDGKEVKLSIRMDTGAIRLVNHYLGTCAQAAAEGGYPRPHQLGQGHNGTSHFLDPIYFWNNTGTLAFADSGWTWPNDCGLTWSDYFQWGRDAYNTGSAKPGYSAYTYPHPLVGGSPSKPVGTTILTAR